MKTTALFLFLLILGISPAESSDIVLSKRISSEYRTKIEKDLKLIENFKFSSEPESDTLDVLGIKRLDAPSVNQWLKARVHYLVDEKVLTTTNMLFKESYFIERHNVVYPEAEILPFSSSVLPNENNNSPKDNANTGFTILTNISSGLYIEGKQKEEVYGFRISRGLLRPSIIVDINSPRTGIIQIGEGLFSPDLRINTENPDALSDSIFRLGSLFHEARHSDGHGKSLGFAHTVCPKDHDYQGYLACDESLNGAYTVGKLMVSEMSKSCTDTLCNESEKEILRLMIIDYASRVLNKDHNDQETIDWDPNPESL